jgi:hypothetical protein
MIDRAKLKSFVAKMQRDPGGYQGYVAINRFMCRCLQPIRSVLPDIAQSALDEAWMFWIDGEGNTDALLSARIACWNYLYVKGSRTGIYDAEDAAVRGVISVLYANFLSDDDAENGVFWFADMFDRLKVQEIDTRQYMVA